MLTVKESAATALRRLTVINLVTAWFNASGYLEFARTATGGPGPFVWSTFMLHFLLMNFAFFMLLWTGARVFPRVTVLGVAPLVFGFQQFFYAVDQKVYALFNFHVNGLVLQILMQPDAMKVLGLNAAELGFIALAAVTVLVLEYGLAFALYRTAKRIRLPEPSPRAAVMALLALFALVLADKVTYAVYAYKGNRTVLAQARVIPFYLPVSMNTVLGKFLKENPYAAGTVDEQAGSALAYPKHPLQYAAGVSAPNVFWINVESWRADSVTPERTPRLWSYRDKFVRAETHFSGGNATRLGMFSIFYGLNPFYWDYFLAERRGPVFFDVLHDRNYAIDVLASASLNFLGTRDTVFRQVKEVHQDFYYRPEVSDVIMLRKALAALKARDRSRPFFQFQFFDSTHAKYRFLPGFDPFTPYAKDISGVDKKAAAAQRGLVLNRYWNAAYYTDYLIGRYLDALAAEGILDNSIIIITGDHGEEFWEHGHFTHSSAFTDQQLRVPMWIHAPGVTGTTVTRLTSHMDVIPTILPFLGVTNPPGDYAQGTSILNGSRDFAVASGWGNYAVIDEDSKISFYATNFSFSLSEVTDRNDEPLGVSNTEIFKRKGERMMSVFNLFGEFLSKPAR